MDFNQISIVIIGDNNSHFDFKVCKVCTHEHMLSIKIYKFDGILLVWLVNLQGVHYYKEVGANKNQSNLWNLMLNVCRWAHTRKTVDFISF